MVTKRDRKNEIVANLKALIQLCGGREQFAHELHLTVGAVNRWIYKKSVPANRVREIAAMSDKFTVDDFLL